MSKDTDWAMSAKGNQWRRQNDKAMVVGQKKDGKWWAMFDGTFAKGSFNSETAAKKAATELMLCGHLDNVEDWSVYDDE